MLPYRRRLVYAFRTFFSILDHSCVPEDVGAALGASATTAAAPDPAPSAPAAAAPQADRALQLLGLLQRDGRLLDFLMEEIAAYGDAQIGAAARDVHAGCRSVLTKYLSIVPVLAEGEGDTLEVDRTTDPSRLKVVGNLIGQPPHRGIVRHRGWEASRVELPPPPAGHSVLAPAEVEVA